jgi:5-methylcytosine-specific restriction enzyme subunit McrC
MNLLFENFINRFIQNNKHKIKINQKYNLNLVEKNPQIGNLFKVDLEPDLLIKYTKNRSMNKILIDFKYKFLNPEKERKGVKREDIYQMFAYSQSQEEKYLKIILFYPKTYLGKFTVLEHYIDSNKKIKIYIRFIDLSKIYLSDEKRFSESNLIEEINKVMMFEIKNNIKE